MGQKTHPLGFRLVTNQQARSIWYADFQNYAKFLEEDTKIRETIEKKNAAISDIIIKRNKNGDQIKVDIHTAKPGTFIGKTGSELKKLNVKLAKVVANPKHKINLEVVQITEPDTKAALIGDYVVEQLEKRIAFRRAMKKAITRAQVANVEGVKIQISGRLNGAEIARSEWIREGRVPLQTLRAQIDYSHKEAHTIYGVLGIKVWLFTGEKTN